MTLSPLTVTAIVPRPTTSQPGDECDHCWCEPATHKVTCPDFIMPVFVCDDCVEALTPTPTTTFHRPAHGGYPTSGRTVTDRPYFLGSFVD